MSVALENVFAGRIGVMAFSPTTGVIGFVLMAALGFLTGLIPALRAMNLDVVTALGRK
jgi:ABC-type antimicrobial peptide transport system permease subunit